MKTHNGHGAAHLLEEQEKWMNVELFRQGNPYEINERRLL